MNNYGLIKANVRTFAGNSGAKSFLLCDYQHNEKGTGQHPSGSPKPFPRMLLTMRKTVQSSGKKQVLVMSLSYWRKAPCGLPSPGPRNFFDGLSQFESGFLFLAAEAILTGTLGMPVTRVFDLSCCL